MSNAKKILRGDDPSSNQWLPWAWKKTTSVFITGLSWSSWAYSNARFIGWFMVTTGMITALPLVFEIKREALAEEMEQMQIAAALAEGRTPQELANVGLTGAIEPKVLK